jgi:hypothetical protein
MDFLMFTCRVFFFFFCLIGWTTSQGSASSAITSPSSASTSSTGRSLSGVLSTGSSSASTSADEKRVVLDLDATTLSSVKLAEELAAVLAKNPGYAIVKLERGSLVVWLRKVTSMVFGEACYFVMRIHLDADLMLSALLNRGMVLGGWSTISELAWPVFSLWATENIYGEALQVEHNPPNTVLSRSVSELVDIFRSGRSSSSAICDSMTASSSSTSSSSSSTTGRSAAAGTPEPASDLHRTPTGRCLLCRAHVIS